MKTKTAKKKEPKKLGRPCEFSQEVADRICALIAQGEAVRQICLLDDMPHEATFYRWLIAKKEFCEQYARAKEIQADKFNEEIIDIADDGRNDWIEREDKRTKKKYIALNEEAIARSRLRVETRKWLMGKHKPKKYGDSTTIKGDAESPLEHNISINIVPVVPVAKNNL